MNYDTGSMKLSMKEIMDCTRPQIATQNLTSVRGTHGRNVSKAPYMILMAIALTLQASSGDINWFSWMRLSSNVLYWSLVQTNEGLNSC